MPFDYEQLDPNIRETVRRLHELGFRTTDSGDGSKAGVMDCAIGEAMVAIHVNPRDLASEAMRLAKCLTAAGIELLEVGSEGPQIQASYDPIEGTAVIALYRVDDSMWPKK